MLNSKNQINPWLVFAPFLTVSQSHSNFRWEWKQEPLHKLQFHTSKRATIGHILIDQHRHLFLLPVMLLVDTHDFTTLYAVCTYLMFRHNQPRLVSGTQVSLTTIPLSSCSHVMLRWLCGIRAWLPLTYSMEGRDFCTIPEEMPQVLSTISINEQSRT